MWNSKDPSPFHSHFNFRPRKPGWWPENEPWPPSEPSWRKMRGGYARRLGCMRVMIILLAWFVFIAIMVTILISLGVIHSLNKPSGWIIPVAAVILLFGSASLVLAGRGLRRLSIPLGELLEAAGRISEGDYSLRVTERGPSEIRALAHAFNGMAERLQLTEEQRRDLMADITHELRTPLTVIQGNLEGFLDGVYPPDATHLKSLLEETQILSRLVDDLRTLALAESGALQLKKEPTDLATLIGETVSGFRTQADAADVKIDIEAESGQPMLNLDPERIHQVIANLIANALRYTPRAGMIHVLFRIVTAQAGKVAEVTVEDTGVGIPAEVLPHIFNRFYKSRDSSGTGLGLPIARHLVEAHGGSISAASQPGQGTTIRFTLPVQD